MKKRFIAILTAVMMLMTCTAVCAETITQTAGTATVQGFGGEITVSVVLEDGEVCRPAKLAPSADRRSAVAEHLFWHIITQRTYTENLQMNYV